MERLPAGSRGGWDGIWDMGYGIWDIYGGAEEGGGGRRREAEGGGGRRREEEGLSRRTVTEDCHGRLSRQRYCHGGLGSGAVLGLFWDCSGPLSPARANRCFGGEHSISSHLSLGLASHLHLPHPVNVAYPVAPPPQNQASRDGQENAKNVVCRELWFMSHRIKLSSSSTPLRKLPHHPSKK